jgi:uncharacterized membrane protein YeaQ/YmgE (transglycosylase-associated protein family)
MSEQRTKFGLDSWLYICIGIPAIFFGSFTVCLLAGMFIASIFSSIVGRYVLDHLPTAWNPERIDTIVLISSLVIAVVGAFVFAVRMTKRMAKTGWPKSTDVSRYEQQEVRH